MKQPWNKAGTEPAIWDVLADPIVMSLMEADRITRNDVLQASAAVLDRREHGSEGPERISA